MKNLFDEDCVPRKRSLISFYSKEVRLALSAKLQIISEDSDPQRAIQMAS